MVLAVYFDICISFNHLDPPVNVSTVLHVTTILFCMSTYITSSLYLFSLWPYNWKKKKKWSASVPTHRSTRKYPHAFPLPQNKELILTTTTCLPAHICTRSWPYLFIFRWTVKNYPSTFPLFYMSTDVPFQQYICSVDFLFMWPFNSYTAVYTQIHPKVNSPVYLHASLPSNHKGLPVTTTARVHTPTCDDDDDELMLNVLRCHLTY